MTLGAPAPHRNVPAAGCASRATLGAAYVARWVWGRERDSGNANSASAGGFEEDIRRMLVKRWVSTGGTPLCASVPVSGYGGTMEAVRQVAASALCFWVSDIDGLVVDAGTGTAPGSGASTPYGRGARAANALLEEEEEEYDDGNGESTSRGRHVHVLASERGAGGRGSPGVIGGGGGGGGGYMSYHKAQHHGSHGLTPSSSRSSMVPSTAYTTPDMGIPLSDE
ncbi:hypothetical protein K438DRAFT_1966918 [Mycena galopus ATCC 62051]|nr:hypothetical protein K438DRAFT_1966918 [Mycena galopus ATCC 62051]